MRETIARGLFVLLFALVFYTTGASFVQSYVNYPTWRLIGPAEFPAYHAAVIALGNRVLLLPSLTATLLSVVVLWVHPRSVPLWLLLLALALDLCGLYATTSVLWHLHQQLDRDVAAHAIGPAVGRLMAVNWVRRIPLMLKSVLYLWMMWMVVRPVDPRSLPTPRRTHPPRPQVAPPARTTEPLRGPDAAASS